APAAAREARNMRSHQHRSDAVPLPRGYETRDRPDKARPERRTPAVSAPAACARSRFETTIARWLASRAAGVVGSRLRRTPTRAPRANKMAHDSGTEGTEGPSDSLFVFLVFSVCSVPRWFNSFRLIKAHALRFGAHRTARHRVMAEARRQPIEGLIQG